MLLPRYCNSAEVTGVPRQVRPEPIRHPRNETRCHVRWIRHPVLYIFDPSSAQNRHTVLEYYLFLFRHPRLLFNGFDTRKRNPLGLFGIRKPPGCRTWRDAPVTMRTPYKVIQGGALLRSKREFMETIATFVLSQLYCGLRVVH